MRLFLGLSMCVAAIVVLSGAMQAGSRNTPADMLVIGFIAALMVVSGVVHISES